MSHICLKITWVHYWTHVERNWWQSDIFWVKIRGKMLLFADFQLVCRNYLLVYGKYGLIQSTPKPFLRFWYDFAVRIFFVHPHWSQRQLLGLQKPEISAEKSASGQDFRHVAAGRDKRRRALVRGIEIRWDLGFETSTWHEIMMERAFKAVRN